MKTLILFVFALGSWSVIGQSTMLITGAEITPESPVSIWDEVLITLTGNFSDAGGMVDDYDISLDGTTVNLVINASSDGGPAEITPFEITYNLGTYDVGEYSVDITGTGILTAIEGPLNFSVEDSTTGIPSISLDFDVRVYPNPSSGLLQVNLPQWENDMRIEVISPQARIVGSEKVISEITNVDLTNLEAGIYMLRIYNADGVAVRIEKIVLN